MRIIVCGGRNYDQKEIIFHELDKLHAANEITAVIQGGARGADLIAKEWAIARNIYCITYPAEWELYGKAAGFKRNVEMADTRPDLVVAFPGGRGTESMKRIAQSRGIPVIEPIV